MMFFITSFFSISPWQVRRRFRNIIKDDRKKAFKTTEPMEKLNYFLIYTVHEVLITWIFELEIDVLSYVL